MSSRGPFSELEQQLLRVPGIRNARVAGTDSPTEIHIVAGPEKSPKQVVRDVQSLASAGFGIPIDHRIVSVVQLEDRGEPEGPARAVGNGAQPVPAPPAETRTRPVLERVAVVTRADRSWVNVVLRWADGSTTQSVSTAESSRLARARAAVTTVLRALDPVLKSRRATIEIQEVALQAIGSKQGVVVHGTYRSGGVAIEISGSAIVHDDISTAAVHATLHAVNRQLA